MRSSIWLLALLVIAAIGCNKGTYEVKGEGTASITYKDGQTQTVKNATLPWKKEVSGLSTYELKAQGTGMLECSITREGKGIVGQSDMGDCAVDVKD